MRQANIPSDPWSYNAFNPAPAGVGPSPFQAPARPKRTVPDQDELYTVQKDLVKSLAALSELERANPDVDTRNLSRQLQNSYKVVNRYLRTHAI